MAAEIRYTKDGVPIFDGSAEMFVPFKRAALTYVETLEWKKRTLAGPRLQMALEGSAKVAVQHQPPGWISHEKGAEALLTFLKSHMTAPSLAEAGKSISRFFYSVKRRKGETMAAWVVRHDEALYEARRTLAEAIEEYGPTSSTQRGSSSLQIPSAGRSHRVSPAPSVQNSSHRRSDRGPFGSNGLLREDDEDEDPEAQEHQSFATGDQGGEWSEPWWQSREWWSSWQWHESGDYGRNWSHGTQPHQWTYDVSAKATEEADRFLPDFVVAWMLLQRSGLDGTEKAAIIANLKNQFTTEKVKDALRLNWSEEDLKRRDQFRPSALLYDEIDDALVNEDEATEEPPEWLDETSQEEFAHLNSEIESALQAIQHHRRTLRDARERQTMMRKNRNFFPPKGDQGRRPQSDLRCYRCGGNHKTAQCPQKESHPKGETGGGAVHFTFVLEPEATALSSGEAVHDGDILSLQSILEDGKAIIDGGATATVASADALDRVQELNRIKGSDNHLELCFDQKPSFRFGNNGRTTCLSTAKLDVPMNDQKGSMSVHVHEIPKQPVLLSIAALRKLGAVIDFKEDKCILKHVDPSRVVQLERAASGHQVFPLTDDVYRNSERREKPFVNLLSDHAE